MIYKGPKCLNHMYLLFILPYPVSNHQNTCYLYLQIDPEFYHLNSITTSTKKEKKIILIMLGGAHKPAATLRLRT